MGDKEHNKNECKEYADAINKAKDIASGIIADETTDSSFNQHIRELKSIDTARSWRSFLWKRHRKTIVLLSSSVAAILIIVITVVPMLTGARQEHSQLADILPSQSAVTLKLSTGEHIALEEQNLPTSLPQGISIDTDAGNISYTADIISSDTLSYDELSLAKGRAYSVSLSDGTKVFLNSESTLKYPVSFVGNERRVILTGEAYFEVSPDEHKPFIVETSQYDIKVLGTKFNISSYPDEVISATTLVSGMVMVMGQTDSVSEVLAPGQQYRYDADNHISSISEVNTEDYISWIDNELIMRKMNLQEILNRLERRYDFTYSISEKAQGESFSGRIPLNENLSIILDQLCSVSDLTYLIEENHVTIQ